MSGQRAPDACPVKWCDETAAHPTGEHVAYVLTEVVQGEHPAGTATVQVLVVGADPAHPRAALVLIDHRLHHISVSMTAAQVKRVRAALGEAERKVA